MATTDKKPERAPSDRSPENDLRKMIAQARSARQKYVGQGNEEKAEKVLALIRDIEGWLK